MLAQNFKAPVDLGIGDRVFEGLVKVLGMLERGELIHVREPSQFIPGTATTSKFTGHFNMAAWTRETECGTVCCIGGAASLLIGSKIYDHQINSGLRELFYPNAIMSTIRTDQAAIALRNYLTRGEARWDEALAE